MKVHKISERTLSAGGEVRIKNYDNIDAEMEALNNNAMMAAEEEMEIYLSPKQLDKKIAAVKKQMEKAAKDLDFIEAARLRDVMLALKKKVE